MTDPGAVERATQMIAALAKRPLATGLVFRGLPEDGEPLSGMTITGSMTATTRDPRVATDNFAHNRLYAIIARKAREVGELGDHPDEAEVVLLPGTVLVPVGMIRVDGMGATAQILEEVDPLAGRTGNTALPDTVDDLIDKVVRTVVKARRAEPIPLTSPGKYAGAIV